jgi:hypothetical protein
MAPMWEAMGGAVLPRFARSFAEQLKARIEEFNNAATPVAPVARPGLFARLLAWLRGLFGSN